VNRANIVIIHGRKGFGSGVEPAYRDVGLLVGDVARRYQQQTLQRAVLTDKRADKLIRRFRQQFIRAGALHDFP
jgi:hypothetical protein